MAQDKRKASRDPRDRDGHYRKKSNLAKERERQGIGKSEFCERMGCTTGEYDKWVSGKHFMSNQKVILAAAILHVSPFYILELQSSRKGGPTDSDRLFWQRGRRDYVRKTVEKLRDERTVLEEIREHERIEQENGFYSIDEFFAQATVVPYLAGPKEDGLKYDEHLILGEADVPPMFQNTPPDGDVWPRELRPDYEPGHCRFSDLEDLRRGAHPKRLENALLWLVDLWPGDLRDLDQFSRDMLEFISDTYSFCGAELASHATTLLMDMAAAYPATARGERQSRRARTEEQKKAASDKAKARNSASKSDPEDAVKES